MKTLVINNDIKIIHIHGSSRGSFYRKFIIFLFSKYVFKKSVVYHIHGSEYHLFYNESGFYQKKMIRFFIQNSDCIICLSKSWHTFFLENFNPKKIEILPNIIDYPKKNNVNKNIKMITFLFLGFVGERKGIFDLLNVIQMNKVDFEGKIKLRIGGNGEIDRLKNFIKMQQLENIVEFLGWITAEEKKIELNHCDVYMLPSYNEGLPISILEAMSYGKPIISTPVGGIPEIVIPEKNGILVKPGNFGEISNAISYFLDNKNKLKEYGENSFELVQNHLPKSVIPQLNELYNKLLENE